ncbi:hypothetical protein BWR19_00510 [Halomonas sp. 1513]|nr:rhodanese-like domain-containing protein [Halomonas sp. 1513]APX91555.1 hypothetical protein BWR19_00510 [Halomonas sp. 1513]
MTAITAQALKHHLANNEQEIAFLDVRELGEFGLGHPFHAVNIPLSRLEACIGRLVPRHGVPIVVTDERDEGRARYAVRRLQSLGYCKLSFLSGGVKAWQAAGYGVFSGVNVVSKTFGELVHKCFSTPPINASTLADWKEQGKSFFVIDGRPIDEYHKMNIPGGICCPNGELAKRLSSILDGDTTSPVVINCAGRTRSIIGAQTLKWLDIDNPVFALENGTQGWRLAGFELEHGSTRHYPRVVRSSASSGAAARQLAMKHGAQSIDTRTAQSWLDDDQRTTYIFDVRSAEEYQHATLNGAVHAPGGQLIQATDQWVGVRGARLLLIDDDECRAPLTATWLTLMGFETAWLCGGTKQWSGLVSCVERTMLSFALTAPPASNLEMAMDPNTLLLDFRPGMKFRKVHLPGSRWVNRSILKCQLSEFDRNQLVVLVGDADGAACLEPDLVMLGFKRVAWLRDDFDTWEKNGVELESTPNYPGDSCCIDYLFFVHDRHDGNFEASRRYLAWETGLLAQLDAQERNVFNI